MDDIDGYDRYQEVSWDQLIEFAKLVEFNREFDEYSELINFIKKWWGEQAYKIVMHYHNEYDDSYYDLLVSSFTVYDKQGDLIAFEPPTDDEFGQNETFTKEQIAEYNDDCYNAVQQFQRLEIHEMDTREDETLYVEPQILPKLYLKT